MKDTIYGLLGTVAVCAAIITLVFGLLGEFIGLDFATTIAFLSGAVLALSIFTMIVMWIFSFDWKESPFLKATFAGILLAILSYIVYMIFEWTLFYTIFIVCATIAAAAVVVGLIKTIFGGV